MADKVLGGRYTVLDKIGIGGMATVYRGLDEVLGRTVAIKMMLPQYAADPNFAARFKQEAQAAAALQSPYIVGVYDWGKDGDTYYIIMEYLRGTDLKTGVRNHGALDCRKVAQIGSQICQALSVAHKHDIIHRDIKPQNIMVQPDGNIKVMDFGIARAKNSHLTQDNSVLGTAHYVSPEQTQGKELGPTSDLYSLGIVMYEAATGKVPFDGDDAISVALKQVNEQPVPPSQLNPSVDATLEGIILKCMQKNPADRFQSADELRRVLNDYLSGRIVNLGEATSLLTPTPTTQMNRTAGSRTQVMNRPSNMEATAISNARIATNQGRATGKYTMPQDEPEERGMSKGKIAAIVIAVLAAIAAIFAGITMLTATPDAKAVPNLIGMTQEEAENAIETSYANFFTLEIDEDYSSSVEEGEVITQDPTQGTLKEKGTVITITVSKGEEPAKEVEVPDLKDLTPEEAEAKLKELNLNGAVGSTVESDEIEVGKVASQDQVAGTKAKEGDTITYHISVGVGQADAGDHTGENYNSAESSLNSVGFTNIEEEWEYSDSVEQYRVIRQYPTGTQSKDNTITLVISNGKDPSKVTTPTSPSSPSAESPATTTDSSSNNTDTTDNTSDGDSYGI